MLFAMHQFNKVGVMYVLQLLGGDCYRVPQATKHDEKGGKQSVFLPFMAVSTEISV